MWTGTMILGTEVKIISIPFRVYINEIIEIFISRWWFYMLWFKNIFDELISFFFKNTLCRIRHLRFCPPRGSGHPGFSLTCHFV